MTLSPSSIMLKSSIASTCVTPQAFMQFILVVNRFLVHICTFMVAKTDPTILH